LFGYPNDGRFNEFGQMPATRPAPSSSLVFATVERGLANVQDGDGRIEIDGCQSSNDLDNLDPGGKRFLRLGTPCEGLLRCPSNRFGLERD
jgi:hypothetical protein